MICSIVVALSRIKRVRAHPKTTYKCQLKKRVRGPKTI